MIEVATGFQFRDTMPTPTELKCKASAQTMPRNTGKKAKTHSVSRSGSTASVTSTATPGSQTRQRAAASRRPVVRTEEEEEVLHANAEYVDMTSDLPELVVDLDTDNEDDDDVGEAPESTGVDLEDEEQKLGQCRVSAGRLLYSP